MTATYPTHKPRWRDVLRAADQRAPGISWVADELGQRVVGLADPLELLGRQHRLHLPGSDALGKGWALWDTNRRRTFFIYGGKWMANFVSPPGLADNGLYGTSTNQAIVNGSAAVKLAVDDYVFLRPTQSEAVLLQFGDLAIVRGGRIEAWWPVLAPQHESA